MFRLRNRVASLAVSLVLSMISGSLMAASPLEDFLNGIKQITEQGEKDRAAIRARQQGIDSVRIAENGQTNGLTTSEAFEEKQVAPTQIVIPKDKKTAIAVEEAMPLIKKIVSMHRCMKSNGDIRQWNFDAVTGVDMVSNSWYSKKAMLPIELMQYHDNNKCLSAKLIDQFSMPANNALLFRAIYFADDSGEVDGFLYLFMKMDDGWKIRQFSRKR